MSAPILLDGYAVKVGSRLWSSAYGWITIGAIHPGKMFPIEAKTEPGAAYCSFSEAGKEHTYHKLRTLFWNEIDLTPPAPPKEMIEVPEYKNEI